MAQVHVLTGPERRRRFSDAEKRTMVAAAFAPGCIFRGKAAKDSWGKRPLIPE